MTIFRRDGMKLKDGEEFGNWGVGEESSGEVDGDGS
jgi:hypothetical protein